MSPLTPFPFDKMLKIRKAVDAALDDGAEPLAAFDADGTLWDMDMGESFFRYQIAQNLLPNLPDEAKSDPWAYYADFHSRDPEHAFLWLAQINKGQTIEQVRQWSQAAFDAIKPVPVFEAMKDLVQHLQKRSVEIYIVTASIKWAVEPAAAFLGISRDNVIGVQTEVVDGVVTDRQAGVITWREGKVTGLLDVVARAGGASRRPLLCAGNTMGDLALLDCATHFRVVNAAAPVGHVNRESEQKLIEIAKKRAWFWHAYRQ
jgi:phosphoserine phosphatase